MKRNRSLGSSFFCALGLFLCCSAALSLILMLPLPALSDEKECGACHEKIGKGKVVHPALQMGCLSCHAESYAKEVPHKKAEGKTGGLISEEPDLCYNCHDKAGFSKKVVHTALGMGCTVCHDPHSSDVGTLLKKEPMDLCLECHGDVRKKPHAIQGFTTKSHPLGEPKAGKVPDDPARPGKKFYCGSCHNPHSSDYMRLFRYKANSAIEICGYCHKM